MLNNLAIKEGTMSRFLGFWPSNNICISSKNPNRKLWLPGGYSPKQEDKDKDSRLLTLRRIAQAKEKW